MLRQRVDIIIRDRESHIVAAVEIKNRKHLTRPVATELYDQALSYGQVVDASYYLLISQDNGFLWLNRTNGQRDMLSAVEFQMRPVIRRYLPTLDLDVERVGESQLEYLVMQWLSELEAGLHQQPLQEPELSFAAVGFLAAIRNTLTLFDVAV